MRKPQPDFDFGDFMFYPLTFHPIFKERVWGGHKLQELYSKPVPQGARIGESWEIADHGNDVSIIANGPLAGKTLRWLMEHHRYELLGAAKDRNSRFPLLVKILDAQEVLSLQVHPPQSVAADLGGEPKTEMWYVADAAPDAEIFAGLRLHTSRSEFESRLRDGSVAECFHRLPVTRGDAMFLPSGRVHAVGAGLVLFEIQQNSDTTYRVFDWNRLGLDGKPRELHVAQALASIDFNDFEPSLVQTKVEKRNGLEIRPLIRHELFSVEHWTIHHGVQAAAPGNKMQIIGALTGSLVVCDAQTNAVLSPGGFCLLPAALRAVTFRAEKRSSFLRIEAGN